MPIDLLNFVRKWQASTHTEKSAAQTHFRDLCEVLNVEAPLQSDEIGAAYTYEKRVAKAGTGETGFADVWRRGWFAWEYKSKGEDLKKAYKQLNEYHESLENPPLLVVCDFDRFEVHTKFENAPPRVFAFVLEDLLHPRDTATCALPPIDVLRHTFGDYRQLRPEVVAIPVTRAAAKDFLHLATQLELERPFAPRQPSKEQIAHFLMRLVFCLFADSTGLLPDNTFRRLVKNHRFSPISFNRALPQLFQAMSQEDSFFGPDNIPYFNGGLFSDSTTIPLTVADLGTLANAAHHDWSHVEPAIFGTLFERSLDSAKRSMIGAHYTSPEDILLLIEPVVVAPLQRRWEQVQTQVLAALGTEAGAPPSATAPSSIKVGSKSSKLAKQAAPTQTTAAQLRVNREALDLLQAWATELTKVRILDPACGSGNFLYLALRRLLDLWHQARIFGIHHGLSVTLDPIPSPQQLYGIEIDFYAHEIASVVVWIGWLQWKHDHGYKELQSPLLTVLSNIQHADAILRYDDEGKPYEPEWPEVEYIIGNPPFLGGKRLRRELGDVFVDSLFDLYRGRVKAESDLVIYWFEKARTRIEGTETRVGLLATQAIRGGSNREVLAKILQSGGIFWAWSDRKWLLQGAAVHVSMVGFDDGHDHSRFLDGEPVESIHANLASGSNTTNALRLPENVGLCFMGVTRLGAFQLEPKVADKLLRAPINVNGRTNADVIKPWVNALDLTRRPRGMWIIDFYEIKSEEDAALYELPYQYIREHVRPTRMLNRRQSYADTWWIFGEPRSAMRTATSQLKRFIATPMVAKHRIFQWVSTGTIPENLVDIIAREDDYFFGLLSSSCHEVWARAQGTQLREVESGFRYTPDSTFDTFPFPWPPGTEPSEAESPIVRAIADAARELVRLRDAWLNPPDATPEELKKRTLTNLYNLRAAGKCTWLENAHRTLDKAVFAAYGWPPTLTTQEILANLLELNHQRAAAQPPTAPRRRSRKPAPDPGP